jgi:ABC-2 type transport system permease protein
MTATIESPTASVWRAAVALAVFSFHRQWRVRALGLVTFALLALMAAAVGIVTHVQKGWRIETRKAWISNTQKDPSYIRMSYSDYASERLPMFAVLPGPASAFAIRMIPLGTYTYLLRASEAQDYRDQYAFINFSRWVVFGLFQTFLLPLFTLAYASGAIGGERESRTLIWLSTRPLPRWAIYVAKFVGVLPWCVAVSLIGFAALCLAGGDLGLTALTSYSASVLSGAVALAALFHLIGATLRRPAIVGLVYIFFFETLVANLPGSLKRLSLNYYVRSLFFNDAKGIAPNVRTESLDVYDPLSPLSSWCVLLIAALVITAIGAWIFSRQEPAEES